jgi:RNA polymerase sigma-70 factor (sigma-E family)
MTGDQEAPPRERVDEYEEIYEAHFARLVRLAVLLGTPREDAEDAVADVFVRTFPHWIGGSVSNIGGYLTTGVTNAARDRSRRAVRFEALDDELPSPGSEDGVDDRDRMKRSLTRLGHDQREVVVLRFYYELSEAETAEVLGVAVGTVKSRQARGLAALRSLMRGAHDA